MDLFGFINTYQYTLVPSLLVFVGILILSTYLGIIFWVTRDVTTRTRNLLGVFGAIVLAVVFYIPGLLLYLLLRPLSTLEETNSLQFLSTVQDPNLINCVNCAHTIRVEHVHCPYCGVNQINNCPSCNNRLHPEWRYCINCGFDTHPAPVGLFAGLKNLAKKSFSKTISLKFVKLPLRTGRMLGNSLKFRSRKKQAEVIEVATENNLQKTTVVETATIDAAPDKDSHTTSTNTTLPEKPIKLNKDGTPRKPRSDAGKKRGKYKDRAAKES